MRWEGTDRFAYPVRLISLHSCWFCDRCVPRRGFCVRHLFDPTIFCPGVVFGGRVCGMCVAFGAGIGLGLWTNYTLFALPVVGAGPMTRCSFVGRSLSEQYMDHHLFVPLSDERGAVESRDGGNLLGCDRNRIQSFLRSGILTHYISTHSHLVFFSFILW